MERVHKNTRSKSYEPVKPKARTRIFIALARSRSSDLLLLHINIILPKDIYMHVHEMTRTESIGELCPLLGAQLQRQHISQRDIMARSCMIGRIRFGLGQ